MNIYKTNLFKYIAGDSLVGKNGIPMTIDKVVIEEIEGSGGRKEEKPVVYFAETKKGMVLNKTNAKRIGKLFGGETDNWKGQVVELYAEEVKAFGETHNAVRIRESKHVKMAQKSKEQTANSTPEQRQARLKENGNLLHGDDTPIGEDSAADLFADEVVKRIPFYGSRAQVFMAMARLGLGEPVDEDYKALCLDALSKDAQQTADLAAA